MAAYNGELLAELRRAKKMTGKELADLAQCSNVTISRIENGHQQPTSSMAKRLARALGVPVERFYFDPLAGSERAALEDAEWANVETQMQVVLEALRRLPAILRAKAIGFILGLATSTSPPAARAAASLAEAAERARQAGASDDSGE
jgi:transcriptional regulator with XRE-family HTH domain